MLAALLFMAIVIPVALQGLHIASRAGSMAERKSIAVQLADSKLNELIVTGQWQSAAQAGDFGTQWPGYRWTVKHETWSQDSMQQVTLEVTYQVQNQDYTVRLSTLLPNML